MKESASGVAQAPAASPSATKVADALAMGSGLGLFAAAALTPGPSNILIVETSIHRGKVAALYLAAGISIGTCLWSMSMAVGIGTLIATSSAYPILAALGAIYLTKLSYDSAVRAVRARPAVWVAPDAVKWRRKAVLSHSCSGNRMLLLKGVLTSLSNPKSAFFWISVMSVAGAPRADPWFLAVFVCACTALAATIYGGFVVGFHVTAVRAGLERHHRALSGLFSGLYVFFAGTLLAEIV